MPITERIWRYVIMFSGIFCISLGVALATKSDLGTSAISVVPYSLSEITPWFSYGTWVGLFNALLAFLQVAILRSKTNFVDIAQQLILCVFFGSFVDAAMHLIFFYNPHMYVIRVISLLISIAILAFGAYLTLISHVGVMAGDGFSRTLAKAFNKDFGTMRVISDSTMVLIAVVLNLIFFHALVCVREGTVIVALATGIVLRFYSKYLTKFEYFILPKNREEAKAEQQRVADMGDHFVITVAREYGSNGYEVAKELAEQLGLAFYDSDDIAKRAIVLNGFSPEKGSDEFNMSPLELFYARYAGVVDKEDASRIDRMFEADSEVVRSIVSQEDCVIVGRLANWILRDHDNCMRVFIMASEEERIAYAMKNDHLEYDAAKAQVNRVDRRREDHCRYCTGESWHDADGYDITLNTSRYPKDKGVGVLVHAAKSMRI